MDFRGNERKTLTKSDILEGIEGIDRSKFIDNNTVEYFIAGDRFIRLHTTDILVFSRDSLRISSGGWHTFTTKERIKKYLPSGLQIYSDNGFWYIRSYISDSIKNFPFKDGMVIDFVNNTSDSGDYEKALQSFKLAKKKETYFINKYADLLISGKMGLPGAGDCFLCNIARNNKDYKAFDHIQSHIDEVYLVPSLIWAACLATNNEYYLRYVHDLQSGGNNRSFDKRDVKRILRKYFSQQKAI